MYLCSLTCSLIATSLSSTLLRLRLYLPAGRLTSRLPTSLRWSRRVLPTRGGNAGNTSSQKSSGFSVRQYRCSPLRHLSLLPISGSNTCAVAEHGQEQKTQDLTATTCRPTCCFRIAGSNLTGHQAYVYISFHILRTQPVCKCSAYLRCVDSEPMPPPHKHQPYYRVIRTCMTTFSEASYRHGLSCSEEAF